jgi:usherin
MWLLPEAPNGFIQSYNIFQDGVQIATASDLNYTSDGLVPDTQYSFFIEAVNSAGSTRSETVMARTLDGIPAGIAPPTLLAVSASSIRADWTVPITPNGDIIRYELLRITTGDVETVILEFNDTGFSTIVSNLMPFTEYEFLVRACTAGGCGSSEPNQVLTLQAPPTFQMQPNVSTLTSESLLVEWAEPEDPNGLVVQYEVRQRQQPFQGNGEFVGNASNSSRSFVVSSLQPFTVYEFSIISYTSGGGTQSQWNNGNTAESGT